MKSHLFRFFTWLCMKTSVVSRRFCVSISSTFYTSTLFGKWNISTHCQLYAVRVPDGLRQLTLSLGDQGYLYFCILLLGTLHFMVSEHINATLHIVIYWKYWHINFSLEFLKSWLSAFRDPGHCSDGSFRTRLFWCCRAAAEFGSQSSHQGT